MTTSIQKDALLAQFSVLAYESKDYLNNPANLPSGWKLVDMEAAVCESSPEISTCLSQ